MERDDSDELLTGNYSQAMREDKHSLGTTFEPALCLKCGKWWRECRKTQLLFITDPTLMLDFVLDPAVA